MQKSYTQPTNSSEKNQPKEIKTPPVPVKEPKRADQIREADKKRFEQLKTIKASMLALLVGTCIWYSFSASLRTTIMGTSMNRIQHQDQGLGVIPVPGFEAAPIRIPEPAATNQNRGRDKVGINRSRTTKPRYPEAEPMDGSVSNIRLFIADPVLFGKQHSPISFVLKSVIDQCKKLENKYLLNKAALEISPLREQDLVEYIDKTSSFEAQNILVVFELAEFSETSGKALYSITPYHKAHLKLVMRGIDIRLNKVLFEEQIDKEVSLEDWARYQPDEELQSEERPTLHEHSTAMKWAQEQAATEIVNILAKYFP